MIKFLKKSLLFMLILAVISVGVCTMIDPHNVFHADHLRNTGVTSAQNYLKMRYILANPDKFNAFIMGSSRVGNIHPEQINGERCYNMTYSEGVPNEQLANLQTMLKHGICPKHIYLGVDSLSYTDDYERHTETAYLVPYELSVSHPFRFWKLFLDPAYAVKAFFDQMLDGGAGETLNPEIFYEYGWNADYNTLTDFDFETAEASIGEKDFREETLRDLSEIVSLCRENGIELTVFTNPMYAVTYEQSVKQGYCDFLEKLAEITPYYNFSGYNSVTQNSGNYLDPSHYNAETSDLVLRCLTGEETDEMLFAQGFGVYITKENVNEWITIINEK